MNYADIIIDISHEKVDKTFQYSIPDGLSDAISVGSAVYVPFGRGDSKRSGYVVGISDKPAIDPSRIKPVLGVQKGAVPIESRLIALAWWMKSHYGSTMTKALKTVLPVKHIEKHREKKLIKLAVSEARLKEEYTDLVSRKRHSAAKERLLSALMEEPDIPWELVTGKLAINHTAIRDIEKAGLIKVISTTDYRNPLGTLGLSDDRKDYEISLNPEQEKALFEFRRGRSEDMASGSVKPFLLYGVTGSGKTEVYIEMISSVVNEGKQAIVLIPEIALTYQTVMRFYRKFGDRVSFLNSRMSPGERYDQYVRAKNGDIDIMVGPRSALFTAFSDLGIIIIDEEHEPSYKSEKQPCYHSVATATELARLSGASVVLGSATPSLESFMRAKSGDYRLIELKHRARSSAKLPDCEIVDLREELASGNRSILSRRLQSAIAERLNKEEQTMLFINRRGVAGFVSCRACGNVIKCPHCDVSLSEHRDGRLHCHYCGFSMPKPKQCPKCASKYIGGFRAGTEKVEEEVKRLFPTARVLRMDADTTGGKEGHSKILSSFKDREADILVGTQMIVKGHDFGNVSLMGILAADQALNAHDFRCGERCFDLLVQAAGRAGRADIRGEVIIQTYQPSHYAITSAASCDYETFYRQEISYRRLMNYPPYAHILLFTVTSPKEADAVSRAAAIAERVRALDPDIKITGPHNAGIAKINDIYRQIIYIKDTDYDRLIAVKDAAEEFSRETAAGPTATLFVDFDPIGGF